MVPADTKKSKGGDSYDIFTPDTVSQKGVAEIGVFLLMLLLPGIDLGFRFKGLAVMLAVRLAFSGIFTLINRKNEKTKKKTAIVTGAVLSVALLAGGLIPAFVFADYQGRPVTGNYEVAQSEAILIDHERVEEYENDGSFREVPAHFYYPANVSAGQEHSMPLIIFSHGAFGYYQSNTSTYMELASNGYVVVSLDHPYHAFYTKDSNGKTILVDRSFLNTALNVGRSDVSTAEVYEITSKWMELRTADMNFVIDTIKAAVSGTFDESWYMKENAGDGIRAALNLTDTGKIGLMGHSLGGATAVTVGRRPDVSAVIDLDGTMLGEETGVKDGQIQVNETPYETPLLCFDSESHHNDRLEARKAGYVYENNVILDGAAEGYSTYIKGAAHMDFTDLPLFSPFLAGFLGRGSVDSAECMDLINSVTLRFFDCFLKDAGTFTVDESY